MWLPSQYEIVTRKYIVPEEGDDAFEMDVVVLSPGYPKALHGREELIAGGVSAAFSVKLTATAAGLEDAVDRARRLRRGLCRGSARPERRSSAPTPSAFCVTATVGLNLARHQRRTFGVRLNESTSDSRIRLR